MSFCLFGNTLPLRKQILSLALLKQMGNFMENRVNDVYETLAYWITNILKSSDLMS